MTQTDALRSAVVAYCAAIGTDPLLVQGAGGNVSWKDGDTLWIKASGTWLAQAAEKDIFVPVALAPLRAATGAGQFGVTPTVLGGSALRPSIETLLHALMPQRVVVHLHAIEVLAHLVRENWQDEVALLLGDQLSWVAVPYKKPGAELAEAVNLALQSAPAVQVVFLQNHGVVIGADDVAGVDALLAVLTQALRSPVVAGHGIQPAALPSASHHPLDDVELHRLVQDPLLHARLGTGWALFPDHVVFLGARAHTATAESVRGARALPDLIFVEGQGVYATAGVSAAKRLQLRCYFDVLVRQRPEHILSTLAAAEIGALLNWDAEQYRMNLSK